MQVLSFLLKALGKKLVWRGMLYERKAAHKPALSVGGVCRQSKLFLSHKQSQTHLVNITNSVTLVGLS